MHNKYNKMFLKVLLGVFLFVGITGKCELESNADQGTLRKLEANVQFDGYDYTIEWQKREDETSTEYYLYLPDAAQNAKKVYANFSGTESVFLNGVYLENGGAMISLKEGRNLLECGQEKYELIVCYGSDIPIFHIVTESGNLGQLVWEKDYRESGHVTILQDGKVFYNKELEYIKGRGNSTWKLDKKPFNIKFKEKINLFQMGEARKWCLLANYLDPTLLKNKLICDFANAIGTPYSPESLLVDLYINDQYMGNYTLMENVEIGDSRVDITDLEKLNEKANPSINLKEVASCGERGRESYSVTGSYKWADIPNIPEIITGGYLLEFELAAKYDSEVSGFVSEYGQPVIIKSPEYAAKEQVEYIKNYYQEFENAVLSGDGYNLNGKHFTDYIDIESFAKMYVLQEFVKNLDAGITSCYFYKDVGGKIVAGPVWDFDSAFGRPFERNGVELHDPQGLWVTGGHLHEELNDKFTIFSLLCRHNEFREEAERQWHLYFEDQIDWILSYLDELWYKNKASILADICKWKKDIPYDQISDWTEQSIGDLREFIKRRSSFVSEIFSEETCTIEYNSNGGSGNMFDLSFYDKGCSIVLQKNIYYNNAREFLGWNTKISGWGDHYEDGASVVLEENLTLYAQWSNPTVKEKIQRMILGIIGQ